MTETMCRPVSRPAGTRAGADDDPALKRRAIVGLSRWDEPGALRHPGENCRCQNQFGMADWDRGWLKFYWPKIIKRSQISEGFERGPKIKSDLRHIQPLKTPQNELVENAESGVAPNEGCSFRRREKCALLRSIYLFLQIMP